MVERPDLSERIFIVASFWQVPNPRLQRALWPTFWQDARNDCLSRAGCEHLIQKLNCVNDYLSLFAASRIDSVRRGSSTRPRTPWSPCFLTGASPANRGKASAICATAEAVIATSTVVKDAWKWPRALSGSRGKR